MRKFSLFLAAAVMAVGLAVSGDASAQKQLTPHNILDEGKILMTSSVNRFQVIHSFTVAYGRSIYLCRTTVDPNNPHISCDRAKAVRSESEHKILYGGKILMATIEPNGRDEHYFTVAYDDVIWVCMTNFVDTWKAPGNF